MPLYFIETVAFTRRIIKLGLESQLKALQDELLGNPSAGDTDSGTGGLRKLRIPDPKRGKGKRSGARVHYLLLPDHDVVYLVFVYGKDDQAKLTSEQKKTLRAVADAIKSEWSRKSEK